MGDTCPSTPLPCAPVQMLAMMARHFHVPPSNGSASGGSPRRAHGAAATATVGGRRAATPVSSKRRSQEDVFDDWCWLTQLQQAG